MCLELSIMMGQNFPKMTKFPLKNSFKSFFKIPYFENHYKSQTVINYFVFYVVGVIYYVRYRIDTGVLSSITLLSGRSYKGARSSSGRKISRGCKIAKYEEIW